MTGIYTTKMLTCGKYRQKICPQSCKNAIIQNSLVLSLTLQVQNMSFGPVCDVKA